MAAAAAAAVASATAVISVSVIMPDLEVLSHVLNDKLTRDLITSWVLHSCFLIPAARNKNKGRQEMVKLRDWGSITSLLRLL
jgi:hypothetical protein